MTDFIVEFQQFMADHGFEPIKPIEADDKWHAARYNGERGGKISGTYSMKIDGDSAVGCVFTRKDPDNKHGWNSKSPVTLTPAERKAMRHRVEALKRKKDAEEEARQNRIATRLTRLFKALPKAVDHPYLKKKGVSAHGAKIRVKGNELIIPLYGADGKVWTIQRITERGDKFLFTGGRKRGSYFPLADAKEDLSLFILTEGFATGASVREATGKPVIVAIDSGNLKPVIIALKAKYPKSRFVIAADNDAFTVNTKKEPWNVGIEKAREAAAAIGYAFVIAPDFSALPPEQYAEEKPTDFNDLQQVTSTAEVNRQISKFIETIPTATAEGETAGLDNAREDIDQHQFGGDNLSLEEFESLHVHSDTEEYMKLVPEDTPAGLPVAVNDDWKQELKYTFTKDGSKLEKKSLTNVYLLTRYSEPLQRLFILNEFSRRNMIVKCPPWENAAKFKPRDIEDNDISQVCVELEKMEITPTADRVRDAIKMICKQRSFHPVQKYFNSLVWDGETRLHRWLSYYLGAEKDPADYLAGVGKKWMVAAVARIMNAGCKFDHMLVLEGATDIGKSAAFRLLSTFHGESYFYDGMTFNKISEKDTMLNIQGSLIIEFPELSSLGNREVEEVKQWITIQEDIGRKPYGREPVTYPRQFVLAGSTNNTQYLKDDTGNKRFWPVACGSSIDMASLERDKGQLWAEAVALYKSGYKYWIPAGDPLFELCRQATEKRLASHPWECAVSEYLIGKNFVTISDILRIVIEKPLERTKKSDEMAIAAILKKNGFISSSDGRTRGWERKIAQQEIAF